MTMIYEYDYLFSTKSNKSQSHSRKIACAILQHIMKEIIHFNLSVECCKVLYLSIPIWKHWDGEGACVRIFVTMSTSTITIARKKGLDSAKRIKNTHINPVFFCWYKWIITNLDAFQSRDARFFVRHSNLSIFVCCSCTLRLMIWNSCRAFEARLYSSYGMITLP